MAVVLAGAVLIIGGVDGLVDEDNFIRYLPIRRSCSTRLCPNQRSFARRDRPAHASHRKLDPEQARRIGGGKHLRHPILIMSKVLLIITKTNDPLNEAVIANEQSLPDHQVKVIDLTSGEPDYRALWKRCSRRLSPSVVRAEAGRTSL